jgi:serine/threonine-protein kinase HipA
MNLLPEGDPLRAMTRALGVAREDVLGLIAETGGDLAGALTIGARREAHAAAYRTLTSQDLERVIAELPAKPFLVGDEGVSMSLAGAHEKLPVTLVDGSIAIPMNGAPSTHILKPDNPRLIGSVQNEALCMVLAQRCGLSVASVTTGLVGERCYLLVARYDRVRNGETVRRLHQEDFCQALGRPPAAKYQHNQSGVRGPSLAEMFSLVRAHMTARDINRLLDAVIFNISIGNVDSHAKNYSILLSAVLPQLAPLYDLMSGLDWANITQNHAQDIGGQRRGRHIYGRQWRQMAEDCGLSRPGVMRRLDALTARVLAELPAASEAVAAMPAGAGGTLEIFARSIAQRARLVRANAQRGGDAGADKPVAEKTR